MSTPQPITSLGVIRDTIEEIVGSMAETLRDFRQQLGREMPQLTRLAEGVMALHNVAAEVRQLDNEFKSSGIALPAPAESKPAAQPDAVTDATFQQPRDAQGNFIPVPGEPVNVIPPDFPSAAALRVAGITTFDLLDAELASHDGHLTHLTGIGVPSEAKILDALATRKAGVPPTA